jgi:hypothetical protein
MSLVLGCVVAGWGVPGADPGEGEPDAGRRAQPAGARSATVSAEPGRPVSATNLSLPPLLKGVAELQFREFFKSHVGPRGLEFTDKLRSLDGKRVRLLGYMVRQSDPTPRCFLFAPLPVKLHEHEYGFADELPASTVHAFTDTNTPPAIPYTPGPMLLTGKLSVGARPEPDGRTSLVRLNLDPPSEEQRATGRGVAEPVPQGPGTPSEEPPGHSH